MKTIMTPKIDRQTHTISAQGQVLGRLAVDVANKLRGKTKPSFVDHLDVGDYVVITDADKIAITGRKLENKIYRRHSGYIGGMTETKLKDKIKQPEEVIKRAVAGMLPHNRLKKGWLKRLSFQTSKESN